MNTGIDAFSPWYLPEGEWKRRGATRAMIQILCGHPCEPDRDDPETDQDGNNLWHYACSGENPETAIRNLLGKANDPQRLNRHGEQPVHRLFLSGNMDGINQWRTAFPETACHGEPETLLHCAAWSGNASAVETALQIMDPAKIDRRNGRGLTALQIALHRCGEPTCMAILRAGADPEIQDNNGNNALHHAAMSGHIDLCMAMEDMVGDTRVRNASGKHARQLMLADPEKRTADGFCPEDRHQWRRLWAERLRF